ncbi:NAD(P)-binding protein [bacterium]|mgnify:CR=1 FL=1|jgi:protoporphyrinogen oxidase|nr:NAD(P)-binding protein [bacterium]
MKKIKYIIFGAGVSGLSFAATLKRNNENDFIIIDKEPNVGGLCRSKEVDGAPLDTGGGHFLDASNKQALDFLFSFYPKNKWNKFDRVSKIESKYGVIDYPYESNIWQFPLDIQIDYLKSITKAGSNNNADMPEVFSEWIRWKLGDKIADDYMLPYNRKIFSTDLDRLGTYWLYKLPNVSFEDTLRACIERKTHGSLPAHSSFYYPKNGGYGIVWEKIGDYLQDHLYLNTPLNTFDFDSLVVNRKFQAKYIINTIPWSEVGKKCSLPSALSREIQSLEYSGIDVDYYNKNEETNAHWVYVPDSSISYHRKLIRHNFIQHAAGYWTETNPERRFDYSESTVRFENKYAYPINTIYKSKAVKNIIEWFEEKKVYALGRWGTWEHMNSDVATVKAIELAKLFFNKL